MTRNRIKKNNNKKIGRYIIKRRNRECTFFVTTFFLLLVFQDQRGKLVAMSDIFSGECNGVIWEGRKENNFFYF